MFFLSNTYRNIKFAIAGLGGIGAAGTIIYGAVASGGIIYIIGGSIWLAQTTFNFFDSSKATIEIKKSVKQLNKDIKLFNEQNDYLKENIGKLGNTADVYIKQNKTLITNIKKTETQLTKLATLKSSYEKENDRFVDENKQLHKNFLQIKERFNFEKGELKKLLSSNIDQIGQLKNTKNLYVAENEKLQITNKSNETQLNKLKSQVHQLKELYSNSLELVSNLKSAGDLFTSFNTSIGTNIENIQDTSNDLDETQEKFEKHLNLLKNLTKELKTRTFDYFDTDNNGTISKEEFQDGINKF